jgi:hypothetical protein
VEEGDKFYRVSNTTQTRFGARLDAVVEHLHKKDWPTPTVQDSNKATKKIRVGHQNNLTAIVFNAETLPTPTSRDYKIVVYRRLLDQKRRALTAALTPSLMLPSVAI